MPTPAPAIRQTSPLCSDQYKAELHQLPRVYPPGWMHMGIWVGLVFTIIIAVVTLLSPMDEYVTAKGQIRPADYAFVFSRAGGILESIEILDGTPIKKGQVLARLDGWEIRKQIALIEGEIAQAEAELGMARAAAQKVAAAPVPAEFLFSALEVERQSEIQSLQQDYLNKLNDLQKTGAASAAETLNLRLQLIASETLLKRSQKAYDLFKGDYGVASQREAQERQHMLEARLAALKTKRDLAMEDLKRLEIIAPADGIVLSTSRRFPGEEIAAGTALFKITEAERKEVRLYATEDRVNLIEPGQLVRFRANNNPDRLAPLAVGRVTHVARDRDLESETSDSVSWEQGTYRVNVAIEKEPYPMAVGATVEAEIVLERRPFWRLLFMKSAPKES